MTELTTPTVDLARAEGEAAGDLGLRRLRRRRHHAADRRRAALRDDRPARRLEGARRRRRQRQRDARRRPPLLRGHLDRLRAGAARARPRPRRRRAAGRSTSASRTPRRCSFPDASFDVVLSTFGVMFTADHAQGGGGDAAGLPARRHDRHGELDARGLHRPGLQDHRPPPAAAAGREVAGALGHAGRDRGDVRRRRALDRARTRRPSPSATARPTTSSRCSAPGTARPTRPSRRSATRARRSRPTSRRCSTA